MESNTPTAKPRSRKPVYELAVICLLSVISIWYFAHPRFRASAVTSQAERLAMAHASDMRITVDKPEQEADRQAEPLLARLRKSPDDALLLADIGRIYYQMGQFPAAAKYYADSVRLKPDAVVFVKLGGAYHFARDDDKAIGAWNHALRLDPNNPDALFNIGFVEWRVRNNAKAAIAAWQKLLRTNPNHPKRVQVEELLAEAKQYLETPTASNE